MDNVNNIKSYGKYSVHDRNIGQGAMRKKNQKMTQTKIIIVNKFQEIF